MHQSNKHLHWQILFRTYNKFQDFQVLSSSSSRLGWELRLPSHQPSFALLLPDQFTRDHNPDKNNYLESELDKLFKSTLGLDESSYRILNPLFVSSNNHEVRHLRIVSIISTRFEYLHNPSYKLLITVFSSESAPQMLLTKFIPTTLLNMLDP